MSLRTRLMLGLVAVAAVGLLAADAATYTFLRSFLDRRVEQQLAAAHEPALRELGFGFGGPAPRGRPPHPTFPIGTYAQLRHTDGSVIDDTWLGGISGEAPDVPAMVRLGETFDVDGYRVRIEATGADVQLVLAVPLTEMRQTLRRLLGIMIAAGAAVLGGLGFLALWIVRVGLRPLEKIEHTAADIAAGDLSRRIEEPDERTEVGRLAIALNAMLAQIEQAFAERTASEERLRRFLADASHELRTPLTSIRGYAELFRRGANVRPDDLEKSMQRIEAEAERMGVLVEDLLVLARLDEGRPLERAPVDLSELAADAVEDARAIDPSRDVTFDANGPVVVEGDETRLRQVLANLLSNVLNHTPVGSPVEVAVSRNDGSANVSVVDHGPGLAPHDRERVFERFYRSDPSRTRETGGVGLGLSIVDAITKAHGGSVVAEETQGGGATFRVTIPRLNNERSA